MTSIKDVSRLAGVSIATVSRVVNGSGPVSERAVEKVERAIEMLGYAPNAQAQSLIKKRSGCVGVMVHRLGNNYYAELLNGIEAEIKAAGYHLLVSTSFFSADAERDCLRFLMQRQPDAMIVEPHGLADHEIAELSRRQSPFVVLGRQVDGVNGHCVSFANEQGAYLATRHLIECGHRRIAHLASPTITTSSAPRRAGYRRALEEAGIVYRPDWVVEADFTEEAAYFIVDQALETLLATEPGITALFTTNDNMAAAAMKIMRERDISVPEDISIVGFDDLEIASLLYPGLTTVRQPVLEMGQAAAHAALRAMGAERAPEQQPGQFEPRLIRRGTVKTIQ
ncbi:MAG: LacI family DNA-binding transcriptional regulator [Pseudomonadota bacterium]